MIKDIPDSPLIKTFMDNGNYFFYTPYRNNVYKVDKATYKELKILQDQGIQKYLISNDLNVQRKYVVSLIKQKIITGPVINCIKHSDDEIYDLVANRLINRVIFQVTQRCNFKCRYCHNVQEGSARLTDGKSDMSFDIANRAIDYVIGHSSDAKNINVYYYGGEPLLNFDLIKHISKRFQDEIHSKPITNRITTNLSLLNEEMANWMFQHDFKIAISLDGGKNRQNQHRFFANGTDTFDVVWNNVQLLKAIYGEKFNDSVVFLPVVFLDEKRDMVLDFFARQGIPQDNIHFQNANTEGVNYTEQISYNSREVANMKINDILDEEDEQQLLSHIKSTFKDRFLLPTIFQHKGPCLVGAYKLFVSSDGCFFPCERVSNYPELCFGNVIDGINLESAKKLINIGQLSERDCLTCWAIRFCKLCLVNCIDDEKHCLNYEVKHLHCASQKKRILYALRKIIEENER